jgi:hypothetical protein
MTRNLLRQLLCSVAVAGGIITFSPAPAWAQG